MTIEALAMALLTSFAQRGGVTFLRALSTPRPEHSFGTSAPSTYCVQHFPRPQWAPESCPPGA